MGIFSFLSKPSPAQVAQKISLVALSLEVMPNEHSVATALGVDISRLVSERVQFMVGLSEATIAYAHLQSKRSEFREALLSLREVYLRHFERLPGVDPNLGRQVYERARARYIMRMPADLAIIFAYQLENPTHWDRLTEVDLPFREVQHQVESLVGEYTKRISHFTFDCCMSLVGK